MKLTPQDIDRMENEQLDAEGRFYSLSLVLFKPTRTSPASVKREQARTGRYARSAVRRHGRRPTLDDIERRQ